MFALHLCAVLYVDMLPSSKHASKMYVQCYNLFSIIIKFRFRQECSNSFFFLI
ncbi:hypothetical protein MtrunA17_Chr3g0080251 [Medicago truncatula]|uniref:Transmembrane protein n=1 Tax=Medicago truncatula TaxID=3880 RepID=A0A396IKX0_MEDTR|nr:hypothetical protein MtrunA17_Chr3g0080251 [Medicago truncatula]